jgi:hypothetical protein
MIHSHLIDLLVGFGIGRALLECFWDPVVVIAIYIYNVGNQPTHLWIYIITQTNNPLEGGDREVIPDS